MGLPDGFQKKNSMDPIPGKGQAGTRPVQKPSDATVCLNRRKDLRYSIENIPVENVGEVVEIGKNGLRIKKQAGRELKDETVKTGIDVYPIAATVAWESEGVAGLKFSGASDIGRFIKDKLKKAREESTPPPKTLSFEKISLYSQKDILTPLVHLMAELESANPDLKRLNCYIIEVHELHNKSLASWQKEKERIMKEEPENKDKSPQVGIFPDLKAELFRNAFGNVEECIGKESDVDCIVTRLGLQSVKKISSRFVRNHRPDSGDVLPKFKNYQAYDALKTVLVNRFNRLFGFQLDITECISLMSLEVCGLGIIMQYAGRDLTGCYSSATRIYSDNMRRFEQMLLGIDFLIISKIYFEKVVKAFHGTYDGYILGHIFLNPFYKLNPSLKIPLTKNKLLFGFLSYLVFLSARFVFDHDKESGQALLSKLRRAGLSEGKAVDFLNNCISEANSIISDIGGRGSIPPVSSAASSFALETYLPKHPQYEFLLKAFRELDSNKVNRLTVTYEDQVYAHLVIDKVLNSRQFAFSGKIHCVIPCENIADTELYPDNFSNFDLLIFKNVDKLSLFHKKAFAKLWGVFEGKIIATVDNYSLFDFNNAELYSLMKGSMLGFPSYLDNEKLYERMLEHAEMLMKPFTDCAMDKSCYADGPFTLEHVRTSELMVMLYQ